MAQLWSTETKGGGYKAKTLSSGGGWEGEGVGNENMYNHTVHLIHT